MEAIKEEESFDPTFAVGFRDEGELLTTGSGRVWEFSDLDSMELPVAARRDSATSIRE